MNGKRLKALREEKGFTQKDLAEKLSLTPKAISFYELGAREPSSEALISMAKILGTSTDYLLGNADIKKTEKIPNDLNKFLEQSEVIFDGDTYNLNQEEKEMVMQSLKVAFYAAKKANKRKKDDPTE